MRPAAAGGQESGDNETQQASLRRHLLVWGLIGLAAVIALVSSLNVWVKEQLLDTDAWVAASSRLLEEPEIRQALAIALTDALFERVDVAATLGEGLPGQLDRLASPIAGLVQSQAPVLADQLLQSSRTQQVWARINREAHMRLVALLEDRTEFVRLSGNEVILDLRPLVERLASRIGIQVTLPAGTGQFTIMRSDQLAAAQRTVRVINVLTVFLGLVVIALLLLAVYLARGFRREALRAAGASLLLIGVIVLIVRRVSGNAIVDALTSAQTRPAGGAVWLIVTDLLKYVGLALIGYGAITLVGAWLAGPSRFAVRIRRMLAPAFRAHPVIVFSGVFLATLLAVYFGPAGETRRLYIILILSGLAVVGVEMLRRQTLREFPPAAGEVVAGSPPSVPSPPTTG